MSFFSPPRKYLVLASNTVRPGQVYRVCVSILESSTPVVVRASLHRDGEQVVGATEMADPHQVTTLLMQVRVLNSDFNQKLVYKSNYYVRDGYTDLEFFQSFDYEMILEIKSCKIIKSFNYFKFQNLLPSKLLGNANLKRHLQFQQLIKENELRSEWGEDVSALLQGFNNPIMQQWLVPEVACIP
ncbi:hypothetical protein AVEN_228775-1 [Araneus ventricosus]|uniref:Uncharacterized protein n=1 Tax=Araneus ventricosus TaxID=182803 RepID=A0A4Y2R743_ARAVE|nr:hypothetical protein AVEN_228775-1 [Araneus ventricosus]